MGSKHLKDSISKCIILLKLLFFVKPEPFNQIIKTTKKTKVEELTSKSPESPKGKACCPAGLESVERHQSAAAAPVPQINAEATGFRLYT